MKRPLAYITAAWCGEPETDTEMGTRYSRLAYEPKSRIMYTQIIS